MHFLTVGLTVTDVSKDSAAQRGAVYVRPAAAAAFRAKCNLSQAGLAALATIELREQTGDPDASVSESLVALIETGRRQPSLQNAKAFAAAMKIPLDAYAEVRAREAVSA